MRPRTLRTSLRFLLVAAVLALASTAAALPPNPLPFDPPPLTSWKPTGCRTVPTTNPVLGPRDAWHMLHSDIVNSDEVSIATAPVFAPDWTAETGTFNVAVPTFDNAGNLYFAPFLPYENVTMISLDPSNGSRRWAITGTGAPTGAVAPMVLNDPDHPGQQIVYQTLYDRALAVRTDGTIVWDVPTGLTLTGVLRQDAVPGANYVPALDAIAGLTGDGHVYLLSRATGAQLLNAPFSLPGEPSPPGAGLALPPSVVSTVSAELSTLINFPPGSDLLTFLGAILGNNVEVSNSFAVDPVTSRLWIAATAPDAADGTVDGVSELGAYYGLDVVPSGAGYDLTIACSRYFTGGSASTPTLRTDGTRAYFGDNVGNLIAIDSSCNEVWSLPIGSQITGSVALSSDNDEIYVSTQTDIIQVFDGGASGSLGWTADLTAYAPGHDRENFNLLLAGIAANGVTFLAGAGVPPGALANIGLPLTVGYGVLDRLTGKIRYFADGLDESVAEMNVAPDGAYYNANSPVRRAFSRALYATDTPPIEGGITKYAPSRIDLLIRDGVCAARDRAANVLANAITLSCPASAGADLDQIGDLIAQARRVAPRALANMDLTSTKWARTDADLTAASGTDPATAVDALGDACVRLAPCPAAPRTGCRAAGSSKLLMKRRPNADVLRWSWSDGAATTVADFSDPVATSDYAVCVYEGAPGSEALAYEIAVPPSSLWRAQRTGYRYFDRAGGERGVRRIKLKSGAASKSGLSVRATGATYVASRFAVAAPVTAQLVNLQSDGCWESVFGAGDVQRSDSQVFNAHTP
ncbi:MAG TPA: hypothetical protein VGK30_20910 [Candidatus Binatia bacterium]|jgi:hypothetical protein